MKRSAIAAFLAIGVATAAPAGQAHSTGPGGPIATIACTSATINGQHKCIARGQFCQRNARAMRDYRRYGLSCTKQDANGRYHLQ